MNVDAVVQVLPTGLKNNFLFQDTYYMNIEIRTTSYTTGLADQVSI